MASITVIPTGGSVAISLEDLAAKLETQPAQEIIAAALYDPTAYFTVALSLLKQTGRIELPKFYFDGATTDTPPENPSLSSPYPDGVYNYNWGRALPAAQLSVGVHTILVKMEMSGTQATATYTV